MLYRSSENTRNTPQLETQMRGFVVVGIIILSTDMLIALFSPQG